MTSTDPDKYDLFDLFILKMLQWALRTTNGNSSRAATLLKMNRTNFYNHLRKFELTPRDLVSRELEGDPYTPALEEEHLSFTERVNRHKDACVRSTLAQDDGNQSKAARTLRITRRRVVYAVRKMGYKWSSA